MGLATEKLGIGVTYSTTYYEPFHVARVFATVDLLLNGRAAWNVVTSLNDSEAANFGLAKHLEHDLRYDRADEFMEVVLGHWDTWEDDAIVFDRESGTFADPGKVHRLDHKGRFFSSRGPFTVPARRRAIRSSSRPDRAGGARNSPRAGANCCSSSTPISQPRRNTIAS
jgi:alkanesulfonate monooxygenase SsuD/methylene tetrahydromethanopterin reductase-like flavin-dependent oxidoreductase (luciferase family)